MPENNQIAQNEDDIHIRYPEESKERKFVIIFHDMLRDYFKSRPLYATLCHIALTRSQSLKDYTIMLDDGVLVPLFDYLLNDIADSIAFHEIDKVKFIIEYIQSIQRENEKPIETLRENIYVVLQDIENLGLVLTQRMRVRKIQSRLINQNHREFAHKLAAVLIEKYPNEEPEEA